MTDAVTDPHSKTATEAPRLYPTLRCRDADAVLAWLRDIVGFREVAVHRADGLIAHAELAYGPSILMLGADRDDDYGRLLGPPGERRTNAIYVAVDDAAGLHERVVASAVTIERPLHDTTYGSSEFLCRDPDGNLWSFGTYRPAA